jgi:hypothetical protein
MITLASPPPILAYDLLPSGSEITIRHDDAGLFIDVPGEPFKLRLRRSLRSPRFWTLVFVIWLSQNWINLLHFYRPGFALGMRPTPLMFVMATLPLAIGIGAGLLINAHRRETIAIDAEKLTRTRGGSFPGKRWEFERSKIRTVRSNNAAVIVSLDRPPRWWRRKLRKIVLLPERDPAELEYVAREMRRALDLEPEYVP